MTVVSTSLMAMALLEVTTMPDEGFGFVPLLIAIGGIALLVIAVVTYSRRDR